MPRALPHLRLRIQPAAVFPRPSAPTCRLGPNLPSGLTSHARCRRSCSEPGRQGGAGTWARCSSEGAGRRGSAHAACVRAPRRAAGLQPLFLCGAGLFSTRLPGVCPGRGSLAAAAAAILRPAASAKRCGRVLVPRLGARPSWLHIKQLYLHENKGRHLGHPAGMLTQHSWVPGLQSATTSGLDLDSILSVHCPGHLPDGS